MARQGKYTSVLRVDPVSDSTRAELAARQWTRKELTARFGEPTSRSHNHGVGTYTVTYLPQGLRFEEAETLSLFKTPAAEIWRAAAEGLVSGRIYIDELIEQGKPSPDGRFRAAYLKGGGYWSQWIVVRETGKSEAIDVVSEQALDSVQVDGEVREFGPAGGNQIWYTGKDGARQYVTVP